MGLKQQDKSSIYFFGLAIYVLFGSSAICYGVNYSRNEHKIFNSLYLIFVAVVATLSWQTILLLVGRYLQNCDAADLFRSTTKFDKFFPFDPRWIIVYLPLGFSGGALPVCMAEDESEIYHFVRGFSTVSLVQFVCFIIFPSKVPPDFRKHPENEWKNSIWFQAIKAMQKVDEENNAFPSGHCSLAAFTCLTLSQHLGLFAYIIMILIGLSCLFTKQHTIPDVAVGYLLGIILYFANNMIL